MHVIQTRPRIDRDPVEVSLRHARRAEAGRDAAAEHVGQAAAAALVQQDEQGQQEAREPSSTCRTTWRISTVNLSGHDAGVSADNRV